MELIPMKNLPKEVKVDILNALGYQSDGTFVIDKDGKRVRDKYVNVDIELTRMLIFPGSTVILDDNPLSVASYIEEYQHAI